MEEWREIEGYEGLFEISSNKKVRKIKTGKIMKPQKIKETIVVRLSKDGKYRRLSLDLLYNRAFGEDEPIVNLKGEIWKDICELEGFEDFVDYKISNMGRVKSTKGACEKIISQSDDGNGYLHFGLYFNGKYKTIKTHRLVGLMFVFNDDKENKKELNHINEIKTDNRAENLEWCDRKYNVNYGSRTERQIENNDMLKRKVICIELNMEFDSIKEACEYMNGSYSNLFQCLNNIRNQTTAFGYHWKYI